jgi:hypothetical protein
MGFLSWFSKAAPAPAPVAPPTPSTAAPNEDSRTSQPAARKPSQASAQRQQERQLRRELLYGIVRESMVRAGVLSASYKFKALALDQRGMQYIVMVDLAREFGSAGERWGDIEMQIAHSAKLRHGILVNAVYWRLADQLSLTGPSIPAHANVGTVGQSAAVAATMGGAGNAAPQSAAAVEPRAVEERQVPLGAAVQAAARPAAASVAAAASAGAVDVSLFDAPVADPHAATIQMPRESTPMPLFPSGDAELPQGFDPIADDEVEAFKRALQGQPASPAGYQAMPAVPGARAAAAALPAAGIAAATAAASAAAAAKAKQAYVRQGANNFTLLTGYEDTEAADPDFEPPALGGTQYGELR